MNIAEAQSDILEPTRRLSNQESCLRLVVVALIGQFQVYIAELLDELCDNLPNEWDQLAPFQKRYVSVQLRRRLGFLLEEFPEGDLADSKKLDRFKRIFSASAEWHVRPSALTSPSNREEVHGFLKDNSSKAIDFAISQFRPDGMQFSNWLFKYHAAYRETFDVLDNAIRLRNEAAHGQVAQRLTLRDARKYRATVYRLVQKADEYLEANAPQSRTDAQPATDPAAINADPATAAELHDESFGPNNESTDAG